MIWEYFADCYMHCFAILFPSSVKLRTCIQNVMIELFTGSFVGSLSHSFPVAKFGRLFNTWLFHFFFLPSIEILFAFFDVSVRLAFSCITGFWFCNQTSVNSISPETRKYVKTLQDTGRGSTRHSGPPLSRCVKTIKSQVVQGSCRPGSSGQRR